jgi:diguanylate cyclase (GGDEF)-like protein
MHDQGDATGRQPSAAGARAPWSVGTYLALIVGFALVAIGGATAYGYFWSSSESRGAATTEMQLEARRAAGLMSSSTVAVKQTVAQLAAQPGLDQALTPAGARACQLSVEGSETFPSIRLDIVSANGHVACSSDPALKLAGPPVHRGSAWLGRALVSKGISVTWGATDAVEHERAVVVTAPVRGSGRTLGAVVGFEDIPEAGRALATNVGSARHPSFTVLDRSSRVVVAASAAPRRAGHRIGGPDFVKAQGQWAGLDGSQRLFGSANVPGSSLRVYAGVKRSAVLARAHGALIRQSLVGLAALLILAAGGWILNRRVAGPLRAFSRAVGRAGREEVGARVEETGTAEMVALARGFNAMLDLRAGHEAELLHQATHDPNTGLPNTVLFREWLDEALLPAGRRAGVAVLCLSVNRLDVVNQGFGRSTGDRVLSDVAARLVQVLRPGDTLARSGGDEFVVLCPNLGEDGALAMAERLQACLHEPFRGPVSDIVLHASVGIALAHQSATSDQLLREADSAMREARRTGEGVHRFDDALQLRATEHLAVEHALWTALQEEQLRVYYQPLIDVSTGSFVGTEALVRWRHPERGMVLPAEFIDIAEETGQIAAVDRYVLTRACAQAAAWTAAGHPLRMSVNVAAGQLNDPEFRNFVEKVLSDTGLSPAQLCLEITESSLMRQAARGAEHLAGLKRLGVALSIDDFGTGYSSLAYLHHLPVDELKVDRSFVTGLGRDRRNRHLVEAIVGMARALGLEVVAEGVESAQQLRAVAALGCTRAQGYLFARPQPADRLLALLEERRREEPVPMLA